MNNIVEDSRQNLLSSWFQQKVGAEIETAVAQPLLYLEFIEYNR